MRLILASKSERRKQLLGRLGIPFTIRSANIDEHALTGESPEQLVKRLARQKAQAVVPLLDKTDDIMILGADTVVTLAGEVLGKPRDAADAARMLRNLNGKTHTVLTGYALLSPATRELHVDCETTRVRFRNLSEYEITSYVATGEPLDKAGAYAIQGAAMGFVAAVEGSTTNVVGLPLEAIAPLLIRLLRPS